ncbi:ImmA/IrrE family metallo-endopeptidase [Nocardia salmonicida]|uniref:ImmA/IrrE family metallo-endopeptidase n=1 Tax=Nocardia salmonicida TaxID=53431 RepID=UPI0007A52BCF|nr:ImmA/IrrE family metallo-endopeptidase [Nocardia salmonicida]
MSKAALARLAAEVRLELGLRGHQPFDPFAWAEAYGVPFVSLDAVAMSEAARQRFTADTPDIWSAALLRDGTGHVVIYNSAHNAERVRSNLAHEVAHLVAEHTISAAWITEPNACGGTGREQEIEAAELAGALLIPVEQARRSAMYGHDPAAVAARFKVSVEMATWRMRMSGGERIAARSRAKRQARAASS